MQVSAAHLSQVISSRSNRVLDRLNIPHKSVTETYHRQDISNVPPSLSWGEYDIISKTWKYDLTWGASREIIR